MHIVWCCESASADLLEKMANAKQSDHIRMLKVTIDQEQLVCADEVEVGGTWKQGKHGIVDW